MMPGRVVCDTGPILHLHECGALDLISRVDTVYLPPSVELELGYLIRNWSLNRPPWLRVLELDPDSRNQAAFWVSSKLIHRGEADALALARQLSADWFLTDDTAARVLAKSLGVETRGSLGVVLWAAVQGYLKREQSVIRLEALFASSLWVSSSVRDEAREALNRIHSSR